MSVRDDAGRVCVPASQEWDEWAGVDGSRPELFLRTLDAQRHGMADYRKGTGSFLSSLGRHLIPYQPPGPRQGLTPEEEENVHAG